jgi:predicted membrane chloride channel (bestrophin family)
MKQYNPGTWNIGFAFTCSGSVFPKSGTVALPPSVLAYLLHGLFNGTGDVKVAMAPAGEIAAQLMSGFTFILGFLIVFRAQTAFNRWWEGGTLLQQLRGEWFNAFSSLMAFTNVAPDRRMEVLKFQHQLARMISMLYASALQQVGTMNKKEFELIDIQGFDPQSVNYLMNSHDQCEVCLQWIQRFIVRANSDEVIKIAPPILSRVFNQLGNGIVNLNNARKITDFAIPFNLAQMITIMLLFHWMFTPVLCALSITSPGWASFVTFLVIFSIWSINYIATELEMPFGSDPNDLPVVDMQKDLNLSLIGLFDERAKEPPAFQFDLTVHKELMRLDVDMDSSLEPYCIPDDRWNVLEQKTKNDEANASPWPDDDEDQVTVMVVDTPAPQALVAQPVKCHPIVDMPVKDETPPQQMSSWVPPGAPEIVAISPRPTDDVGPFSPVVDAPRADATRSRAATDGGPSPTAWMRRGRGLEAPAETSPRCIPSSMSMAIPMPILVDGETTLPTEQDLKKAKEGATMIVYDSLNPEMIKLNAAVLCQLARIAGDMRILANSSIARDTSPSAAASHDRAQSLARGGDAAAGGS